MPRRTGEVVGKDFKPPAGSDPKDWCYLVVDLSDGELVSVRLNRRDVDTAALGDRVEFNQPRRAKKKSKYVHRLG